MNQGFWYLIGSDASRLALALRDRAALLPELQAHARQAPRGAWQKRGMYAHSTHSTKGCVGHV